MLLVSARYAVWAIPRWPTMPSVASVWVTNTARIRILVHEPILQKDIYLGLADRLSKECVLIGMDIRYFVADATVILCGCPKEFYGCAPAKKRRDGDGENDGSSHVALSLCPESFTER